ncbi:MAG: ABC transporter permease [Dehalococcoidia bacterium]
MFGNLKGLIMHSLRLGIKDLLVFARDRMMLIAFVVMPIFMMLMVGFIFPSQNVLKDVPFGVVNLDEGSMGDQIVLALQQMNRSQNDRMFAITYLRSKGTAVDQIKYQTISGALIIPSDFSAKISTGEQASVILIIDQSNPQVSAGITGTISGLMSVMANQLASQSVAALLPNVPNPQQLIVPFTVQTEGVVAGKPNYFEFVAPGIMAMTIMMAAMTGLAGSISRERELGTLDGIISAPISRLSIILGKSFAQVVRGLLQALLTLILTVVFFGVVVHGSYGLLALLLLLTVFSFIGIGIMISALASQQETAMTIMMTLTFPMLFLSGALFPVQQMPVVMQWISKGLPLTYAVEALRKCVVLGTGISGMMTQIWVMLGFGVIFTVISIPVFNRAITR